MSRGNRREIAEANAEREVSGQPKSHPRKARIAQLFRKETTITMAWIAKRLKMGIESIVSQCRGSVIATVAGSRLGRDTGSA